MAKSERRWGGFAFAIAAAAIALPVGILIGRGQPDQNGEGSVKGPQTAGRSAGGRNIYSPSIHSDPYVLQEQKRVAEALELSCAQSNLYCDEARQAWLRIDEAEAGK